MAPAAGSLLSALGSQVASSQAAGWMLGKTGITAAAKAAATKGLMTKLMIGQGALSLKQGIDAKKAAKKGRLATESSAISSFDRSFAKKAKVRGRSRRAPGRRGLTVKRY